MRINSLLHVAVAVEAGIKENYITVMVMQMSRSEEMVKGNLLGKRTKLKDLLMIDVVCKVLYESLLIILVLLVVVYLANFTVMVQIEIASPCVIDHSLCIYMAVKINYETETAEILVNMHWYIAVVEVCILD